jgi:hypothetical protein
MKMQLPRPASRQWLGWPMLMRRLVAIPALLIGGVLLVQGLPRTLSALLSGEGEPIIRRIEKQEAVSIEELNTVAAAEESGLAWVDDPVMRAELGLAHLLLAEKLPRGDPAIPIHLQHARQMLRASLGQAPANPYPWTLLAYSEFLQAGTWTPAAVSALRVSMLTGAYDPRLLWSRLRLSLLAWASLSDTDQDLTLVQIRYAWAESPKDLARLAVELRAENIVRAALLQVPGASAQFEELLKAPPGAR